MKKVRKVKPRNREAINPLMNKGHSHKSKKDYDRNRSKGEHRAVIADYLYNDR